MDEERRKVRKTTVVRNRKEPRIAGVKSDTETEV